jgi:plastocyanin domain-containing protein
MFAEKSVCLVPVEHPVPRPVQELLDIGVGGIYHHPGSDTACDPYHGRRGMNTVDLLVIVGGAAAIVWVNWYFLLANRPAARAAAGGDGVQEIRIRVAGGYSPSHVRVRRGAAVRLLFDRQEASGCSEEVVLPDFGIRRFLPANRETAVEFTSEREGDFEFMCGMGMIRGRITVEDESNEERG